MEFPKLPFSAVLINLAKAIAWLAVAYFIVTVAPAVVLVLTHPAS